MTEENYENEHLREELFKTKLPGVEWMTEQMPGGFFIYHDDEEQEIIYANRPMYKIFGCENLEEFKELTGNTFRGMVHPDDFDKIQSSIDDQIADTDNSDHMDYVVYRIIRKDGEVRWVDDYGRHVHLPGSGDVFYVFIGDITDTRIAEEERKRNLELIESLKEAEEANKAKSEFLSGMSHEIRTPINAILGMNEMILREAHDPEILRYASTIKTAGVNLLNLLSDILDISKIEAGQFKFVNEKYSLVKLIRDLYNFHLLRAEEKGLYIRVRIGSEIPRVLVGDELKIKQVLTNLITNAIKYTKTGGVSIDVSLKQVLNGKADILFSVKDTGIGIAEEKIDRLFEAYDRLDLRRIRNIEGTGLGLAITKNILSLMGSELLVESKYNEGSRFYFVLRQTIADKAMVGNVDPYRPQEGEVVNRPRKQLKIPGKKVLIVDDVELNVEVVTGLLKETEMDIDVAMSGMECIEMFGRTDYDLVLLDYLMPHMDGIETLKEMRRRFPEKVAATPIISLTANVVSGERERMLEAGFTDYLTKPIIIETLEDALRKYLGVEDEEDNDEGEDGDAGTETPIEELLPQKVLNVDVLDAKEGLAYCGNPKIYLRALEIFKKEYEGRKAQMEEGLEKGDFKAFTIVAHSLKSNARSIGAQDLFEKARGLEEAGKAKDLARAKAGYPEFLREYTSLVKDIAKALE